MEQPNIVPSLKIRVLGCLDNICSELIFVSAYKDSGLTSDYSVSKSSEAP